MYSCIQGYVQYKKYMIKSGSCRKIVESYVSYGTVIVYSLYFYTPYEM
jgi:hypothetical protein